MHLNPVLTNTMPQVQYLCHPKLTFGLFGEQGMFFHNTQNLVQMLQVLPPCPAINKIIKHYK